MPTSPAALISACVERVARLRVGDAQRALAAAKGVVAAALVAFHALEEGQDVVVAPAAVAHLRPGVEVLRLAAHEGHAVDRAGAAEQLAARHREAAAVGVGLGLGGVEPVGRGVVAAAWRSRPGCATRDGWRARPPAAAPCCAGPPTAGSQPPRRPIRRRRRCSRSCVRRSRSRAATPDQPAVRCQPRTPSPRPCQPVSVTSTVSSIFTRPRLGWFMVVSMESTMPACSGLSLS